MNVIDIESFKKGCFEIKIEGKAYLISFIPSIIELELTKNQVDYMGKITAFNITDEDLEYFIRVCKLVTKANYKDFDETYFDNLGMMELITCTLSVYNFVIQRSHVLYDIFDDKKKATAATK